MKHLVTSGCSFTISDGNGPKPHGIGVLNRSWAYALYDFLKEDNKDLNFHNVGMSGAGNYIISMTCIDTVECLLNDGVKPEDIYAIVQWSGLFRPALHSRTGNFKEYVVPFDEELNTTHTNLKNINDHEGCFIHASGKLNTHFWKQYLYFYDPPSAFIDTLDMILRTQWYLSSKGIKYKMFTGWDIFTASDNAAGQHSTDIMMNASQFSHDVYCSIDNVLLKDVYHSSSHLWDKIDFNNFLFFDNDNVKCGGMLQWIQHNVKKENWYVKFDRQNRDCHPPSETAREFAKNAILPIVQSEL